MNTILKPKSIPLTLAGLGALVLVCVFLIPPEQKLGGVIRIVLVHGALARAGLLLFTAAGVMGAVLLARPRPQLEQWTLATQKTSFGVWLIGALTSAIATYLSWGVLIAWGEPRTQATVKILAMCVLFLLLAVWIREARFTAVANIAIAVVAWLLVTQASSIQHPVDPVGRSGPVSYRVAFLAMVAIFVVMAVQSIRWLTLGERQATVPK